MTRRVVQTLGEAMRRRRTLVMGVLNVTPDSFSDGGRYMRRDDALRHAGAMAAAGADIVDVGGESTRPGATPVSVDEEIERVVPVVEALAREVAVPISVDTSKPAVMRAAVAAGAALVNDVTALRARGAEATIAALGVPVCLMHMRGVPRTMQDAPQYADVVSEVRDFLLERARACEEAGVPRDHILLDPGFGFGKTTAHNLALLRRLERLVETDYPVVVGLSRKSMIARLLGRGDADRGPASVALAVAAARRGARVVRVHDVGATRDAILVTEYTEGRRELEE